MKQCRQFKHLLEGIKKHSNDVRIPSECFANGTIKGHTFRLFQELNVDKANGTDDKYSAYLCIKDEKSKGSMWSTFYDQVDIDEWVALNSCTFNVGDEVELEVYGEICCEICGEIIHNHIDCPVCKSDYAGTDKYSDLCDEEEVTCEDCGTTFTKISDSWYYDCKAKIVSIGKNCH